MLASGASGTGTRKQRKPALRNKGALAAFASIVRFVFVREPALPTKFEHRRSPRCVWAYQHPVDLS